MTRMWSSTKQPFLTCQRVNLVDLCNQFRTGCVQLFGFVPKAFGEPILTDPLEFNPLVIPFSRVRILSHHDQ